MGVVRGALGPWFPKYIISIICLPLGHFYQKVVLRLSEHGDVIKYETRSLPVSDVMFWCFSSQCCG